LDVGVELWRSAYEDPSNAIDRINKIADIPTTVRVIKAGAEDLLTKPIAKEAVLQAIERALARSGMMREKHEDLDVLQTSVNHLTPRT
jgi:FixJ family two-component response regulator